MEETIVKDKRKIKSFQDLEVYQEGYELSMRVYSMTSAFPSEERYSLVSQMRNASRSVPANIAEGWAKRTYEAVFKRHLMDALGSANEMQVWLDMTRDCNYSEQEVCEELKNDYETLAKRLYQLHSNWKSR